MEQEAIIVVPSNMQVTFGIAYKKMEVEVQDGRGWKKFQFNLSQEEIIKAPVKRKRFFFDGKKRTKFYRPRSKKKTAAPEPKSPILLAVEKIQDEIYKQTTFFTYRAISSKGIFYYLAAFADIFKSGMLGEIDFYLLNSEGVECGKCSKYIDCSCVSGKKCSELAIMIEQEKVQFPQNKILAWINVFRVSDMLSMRRQKVLLEF